jgi:predicted hotdog family 3-hydroxylacyl-ACP dehydratase
VIADIAVPSGGAYFEGHFPGRPILPGVAELELVLAALIRETRQPVVLRGLAFARLRQLVLPGDRLGLTTRELDGGRLRFDLRREGMLVANGEFILGPPGKPCQTESSLAELAPPLSTPPLDALLPQRPPMRWVTAVLSATADGILCTACIPAACALVCDGSASALAGLEAAAQAAAAWESMRRWREEGVAAPRIGYLVALRDVVLFAERLPAGQSLLASVRLSAAAPPLAHYQVEVSLGGLPMLRGTIATFLVPGSGG